MKFNRTQVGRAALLLIAAYFILFPAVVQAAEPQDSAQISRLLADAKVEAMELLHDSDELLGFASSQASWISHARQLESVKEHVNKTGRLLAKLQDAENSGSPWQQDAIRHIEPLLKELADNTTATINHLNENQKRIPFGEYRGYVKANYDLAKELDALIRDFVDYGEAKKEFEKMEQKLTVTE